MDNDQDSRASKNRRPKCLAGFCLLLCVLLPVEVNAQSPEADASAESTERAEGDDEASPSSDERTEEDAPADSAERTEEAEEEALSRDDRAAIDAAFGEMEAEEDDAPRDVSSAQAESTAAARAANMFNPEIALILDVAASWFSDEPGTLGAHDPQRTGFTFQQLEMALGASVDPYFRLDANLVFSEFGVEVEEAYATTLGIPGGLQFRAGQFLTRFGRVNATHPHSWHFVDQPLVLGKFFGGESNRGLGIEGSWLIPLPWYAELVASVNEADGDCCMRSYFGADRPRIESFGDFVYTIALKQFFPFGPDWGLNIGVTAQLGPNGSGTRTRTDIYGADIYLRYKPTDGMNQSAVSFTAEVMHRRRQVPDDLLVDTGGYAQLVWRIDRRWEIGGRYEFVTGVENDTLDPEWTELRDRSSVQGTVYPSHFSRIRIQGGLDRQTYLDDELGWSTTLNLEFLIGAHGAHDY